MSDAVDATYYSPTGQVVQLANRALALAETTGATGAGITEAHAARGQALAITGHPDTTATLDSLEDAFADLPSAVTDDRSSALGWSEQARRFVQSHVYTHLGDPRAVDVQDAALALYPPELYVDPAVVKLHRASWLVRTGDPSEGLRHGIKVLSGLPSRCQTHEVIVTARDVARALPPGAEKTPEAVEYRELLAAT